MHTQNCSNKVTCTHVVTSRGHSQLELQTLASFLKYQNLLLWLQRLCTLGWITLVFKCGARVAFQRAQADASEQFDRYSIVRNSSSQAVREHRHWWTPLPRGARKQNEFGKRSIWQSVGITCTGTFPYWKASWNVLHSWVCDVPGPGVSHAGDPWVLPISDHKVHACVHFHPHHNSHSFRDGSTVLQVLVCETDLKFSKPNFVPTRCSSDRASRSHQQPLIHSGAWLPSLRGQGITGTSPLRMLWRPWRSMMTCLCIYTFHRKLKQLFWGG